MDIKEKAELAASLKKEGRCNCCQAVTAVMADDLGVSADTMMKLSSGFAVGMGTMENTCGALIGAALAAGLKCEGKATVRVTREMTVKFKERCGSVICRELKGIGTGQVLCPCEECVRNAVLIYGECFPSP